MTEQQSDIFFDETSWDSIHEVHRFSHEAMATTFEIFIVHSDSQYAAQAAWAAFDELDQLETELSRFIENSDISRINNLRTNQPLRIGLLAFECLQLSGRIYDETEGAFDITIGSLLDCWLGRGGEAGRCPSKEQLGVARQRTGLHLMELDEAQHTVNLLTSPVQIDLGGIGKGYAIDEMARLLRDWSIEVALIHSGCSSVLALGAPRGTKGWPLTISNPSDNRQILAYVNLQNRALSGSGLQKGRHIIDPRTTQPVEGKVATWACTLTAAMADALSTAFMVMSPDEINQYCLQHLDTLAMVLVGELCGKVGEDKVLRFGPWKDSGLMK